jgi:hypothetical protein
MAVDLLLITPGFPAGEWDTTCVPPLQEYLIALRKARPELSIAVIATQYPYTNVGYHWNGLEVHPCNGRITNWRRPLAWWRASRAFDRIRRRGPIGAVHSLWLGECAMLNSRFAQKIGAPHVLTLMGQDARAAKGWWDRMAKKPVTVALTPRHAATFQGMTGRTPDAVVPWGIDRRSMARARQRDVDILFVGSMIGVKNPIEFVVITAELRKKRKILARMVGGGPLSQAVKANAGHDFGAEVHMVGELSRPEVLDQMAGSRILVHTSTYESQGYVFDEALLNGMSIVSRVVGSARQSERWRIADTWQGMVHEIEDLLDHPPTDDPLILHPVDATVNEYLRLYGLL